MLIDALINMLNPQMLLLLTAGTVWGVIFGAVPGLTTSLALVVLLPVTYSMAPISAIAMLVAIYIGAASGSLVSSILLGIPGMATS